MVVNLYQSGSVVLNHNLCRWNPWWDEPGAVLPVDQRRTTTTSNATQPTLFLVPDTQTWDLSQETTMTTQLRERKSRKHRHYVNPNFSLWVLPANYMWKTCCVLKFLFWYFGIKADIYLPTRPSVGRCCPVIFTVTLCLVSLLQMNVQQPHVGVKVECTLCSMIVFLQLGPNISGHWYNFHHFGSVQHHNGRKMKQYVL